MRTRGCECRPQLNHIIISLHSLLLPLCQEFSTLCRVACICLEHTWWTPPGGGSSCTCFPPCVVANKRELMLLMMIIMQRVNNYIPHFAREVSRKSALEAKQTAAERKPTLSNNTTRPMLAQLCLDGVSGVRDRVVLGEVAATLSHSTKSFIRWVLDNWDW